MRLVLDGVAARHPAAAPGRFAIADVHLSVAAGERIALVGPSGAGKTTLLMVASLQLRPAAGRVTIDGVDPWSLPSSARHRLRRRLFVAPQVPPLPPRQRVVTAVLAGRLPGQGLIGGIASWIRPREAGDARAALATMDLADKLWLRVDRLSGGERQRVALARLLVSRADLWFVDEPLSALDPTLAVRCIDVLVDAASTRGATLLASLHQIDLAVARFPRLVGIARGRIAFDRATADVDAALRDALYANEEPRIVPAGVGPAPAELADAGLAQPVC